MAALCACGCFLARRLPAFRYRKLTIGLLFGGLSIVADHLPVATIDIFGVDIVLRDAPVMVAGFFFGQISCVIAGVVATVEAFLRIFIFSESTSLPVIGATATLLVSFYTFILVRWIFDGRPPTFVALVAALYGVILHEMAIGAFVLVNYEQTLEVIVDSVVPLSVGVGLAILASSLVCGFQLRDRERRFLSNLNLGFIFFGLAVAAITAQVGISSKLQSEKILHDVVSTLESSVEDQLVFMLHEDGESIVEMLAEEAQPTTDYLQKLARQMGVDVITLVSSNGIITASTEKEAAIGKSFFAHAPTHQHYKGLLKGNPTFTIGPFEVASTNDDRYIKFAGLACPQGGFVQIGYEWESFASGFERYFMSIFERREIGESGFFLICDSTGHLVSSVPGHPDSKGASLEAIGFKPKNLQVAPGTCFRAHVFDVWSRCIGYDAIGKWRFYAVLPLAEHQGPALLIIFVAALVLFIVFASFRVVLLRSERAQKRLDSLRAEEERRRIEDLELARTIQRSELPTDNKDGDGYSLRAYMEAAREVGGDFYDYYTLPDGRLVVAVADVSGKGIPAAIFMMRAKAALKECVLRAKTFSDAVAEANKILSARNTAEMFVTVWIGIYDAKAGTLEYISAGHNAPLVLTAGGSVRWVTGAHSSALGVFESARYQSSVERLSAGDSLFLYTDGVTEAMNARGELYGNDRLECALARAGKPVIPDIILSVGEFAAGAIQADDMTMLILEARGQ